MRTGIDEHRGELQWVIKNARKEEAGGKRKESAAAVEQRIVGRTMRKTPVLSEKRLDRQFREREREGERDR